MTNEQDDQVAKLQIGDQIVDLPIVDGTQGERAINVADLRKKSGYITLDPGYRNTGSCRSSISFIDGERGILRYRGIPIEQLAAGSTFVETAMLLIWGDLPSRAELASFRELLTEYEMIPEGLYKHYDGFPAQAPPMAILSAMINAISCYHPEIMEMEQPETLRLAAARLLSMVRTIAAGAYKTSIGEPIIYPKVENSYCQNFLHMMFSRPYKVHEPSADAVAALEQFLMLYADHEQDNCTSTVRMVASSGANLFASCAAGVCSLWGWRHGGANGQAIRTLEYLHQNHIALGTYLERVKRQEVKLMGFGHRVYRSYDPRARILQGVAERLLSALKLSDPLFDLARRLEAAALADQYFIDRHLYPNVDFYSGIILRALGIPLDMFTVLSAMGRMPGWIANWKEVYERPEEGIVRPRQVYTGPTVRAYVPVGERGQAPTHS